MLTEPTIDKSIISAAIENNFSIQISNLTFIQGGEASWGYKVEDKWGTIYFFKIHANLTDHEKRFELMSKLYMNGDIKNIAYPIKTTANNFVVNIGNFPCALFPFISGSTAAEKPLNEKQCLAFGELLGRIHTAKDVVGDFTLKEDFIYSNANRLLKTLREIAFFSQDLSPFKRRTAELLSKNKDKIDKRMQEIEALGNKLRRKELDFVICHGEPHKWNTLVDERGEVFLIDWDDCLFAPKEKDLTVIKDDSIKLDGYRNIIGDFSLNKEVLRYYELEWNISEIDAWSNSLLHQESNDLQYHHFLDELESDLEELHS